MMASKIVNEDEESLLLHVNLQQTKDACIFLVSEPELKGSHSARNRKKMEDELHSIITKDNFVRQFKGDIGKAFNLNDFVAVCLDGAYKRGQIVNKIFRNPLTQLQVRLLDWGSTVDVLPNDLASLPKEFISIPFYSRLAVLGGIQPLASMFDPASPNCCLRLMPTEKFDESGKRFIEDKLKSSTLFKMAVLGLDVDNCLHIRLYFNQGSSYICLNDMLCDLNRAARISDTSISAKLQPINPEVSNFWEKLPLLPMQMMFLEEKRNCYSVGFTDYAAKFEEMKKERLNKNNKNSDMDLNNSYEIGSSSSSLYASSVKHRDEDEAISDPCTKAKESVDDCSPAHGDRKAPFSFGRGRNFLKMLEHLSSHSEKKRFGFLGVIPSDSNFDDQLLPSPYKPETNISPENVTENEIVAPIPTTLDELETFADRANGRVCKPKTAQKINTSSDESSPMLSFSSTSSDSMKGNHKLTDGNQPFPSIGRGYLGSQLCPAEYAGPNVAWFESNPQHVLPKIKADSSNFGNGTSNGIGNKKVASLQPDLPCMPAGMVNVADKPINQPRIGYSKINNPYKASGVGRNHVQRFGNSVKPAFAPQPMEPLVKKSSFGIQINDQTRVVESHPTFNPSKRLQAMKVALAKTKTLEQRVEKPEVFQAEALPSPVDDDEEMEELLMLASGFTVPKRSNGSVGRYEESSMLKSAKLAGMIEEGRVLVLGPIQRAPTHNLNETNFDATILEALNRIGIQKPKLIQAHVWEPILSFSDVAFVSGSKTGKTLGYLVPVMNNLLDEDVYSEVPKGCSPLAIVICPSWRDAETVHEYFTQMMRSVKGFRSGVLVDGSSKSLSESVGTLVNGVTLLAATAPALNNLFQEANSVINFDRCCHLVFENTDLLLKDHGEAFKHLIELYYGSCKRMKDGGFNFVRQIIACSEHWTKSMQSILDRVMKTPYLFISSCLEAAIYGGMELDVRHGTSSEMDSSLLKIIEEKRTTRTIVFCRSNDEIAKLQEMLSMIGVKPLVAHNRSVVSDLDSINRRWEISQPGCAILLCIDDVLYRLNIKNAQTLIHYFIPTHSKYDFSLRFSFSLDRLKSIELESERPVSHLLITEEFKNALLTIVRIMPRFGHVVSEDLKKEAMLSYCDKEFSKTQLPLCIELKSFGSCRNTKLCFDRHLIMESFDKPVIPNCGLIRIRITAVHTTTRYYARILKYQCDDKFVDTSASRFEVHEKMRNHYLSNGVQSALETDVKVGNWYARRSADDLFERVRVEEVLNYNHQKVPMEVKVISIDQGCTFSLLVQDLIELPECLKSLPPEAIEVYLAGVKPLDKNTEWSRRSIEFARAKLMNKVLDGHIVLALSSSLWLKPLYERKTLDGMKDKVVVMDILSDLIKEEMAVKNDEHMAMLYHLCETGEMALPDHSLKKRNEVPVTLSYAFLSIKDAHEVEVSNVESPSQFYVVNVKFQKILEDLEVTIRKNISRCKKITSEEAQPGKLVIAEEPGKPGAWCRGVVKKILNGTSQYEIFFVDYGDFSKVSLNELRALPREFVSRLPFQAIACSLKGLKPVNSTWTAEAKNYFSSLTRDSDNCLHVLNAIPEAKQQNAHEVTGGPHYLIQLINRNEGEPRDLSQVMISKNFALPLENNEDASSSISLIARAEKEKARAIEKKLREEEDARFVEQLANEEFDVSPDWLKDFRPPIPAPPLITNAALEYVVTKPHDDAPSPPKDDSQDSKSHKKIEEEESEPLIVHTLPLKSSTSRFPSTKWCQNDDKVFVTFQIDGVLDYEIDYSSDYLTFAAEVNGIKYELKTTTFRNIIPEQSHDEKTSVGVKVTLRKQQSGFMWNRLIISPFSQQWLTRDFSAWTASDDTDDKLVIRDMNVDAKYAFEVEHSESSVSTEGDFFSDDEESKYE